LEVREMNTWITKEQNYNFEFNFDDVFKRDLNRITINLLRGLIKEILHKNYGTIDDRIYFSTNDIVIKFDIEFSNVTNIYEVRIFEVY
jgi:hypothetical protein